MLRPSFAPQPSCILRLRVEDQTSMSAIAVDRVDAVSGTVTMISFTGDSGDGRLT